MLWRSWLRHCATSRKDAGSIPHGVIGIFYWHNPSGRTMSQEFTQPLTEMSKVKVKWSRYRPSVAQRVGRGIALLFHDRGTRRGEWPAARPGRTLPPGKTRYPFYRRLGGLQGRSGWAENVVPTAIRSRTVQPVVSRYTSCATRPTTEMSTRNMSWG